MDFRNELYLNDYGTLSVIELDEQFTKGAKLEYDQN